MPKIKIYLYGKYSDRTPLSYEVYRSYFTDSISYETRAEDATFLVTGFIRDFEDNTDELRHLLKVNPDLKLVVLSEEPLWDTVWNPAFQNSKDTIRVNVDGEEITFDYYILNHVTSNIFNFEKIPYLLTTNDNFYTRYKYFFQRNAQLKASDYKKIWETASLRYAFLAARRIGKSFEVSYNRDAIKGLNRFRSLVCEGLKSEGVLRVGKGWGAGQPRQDLDDWHEDKLTRLDGRAFIVSALENTHLKNYISEKIFDAYAVQAVPIYYAKPRHDVFRLAEKGSFINLADLNVRQAVKHIKKFKVDNTFLNQYISTQKQLNDLFKDPKYLLNERERVVDATLEALKKIL